MLKMKIYGAYCPPKAKQLHNESEGFFGPRQSTGCKSCHGIRKNLPCPTPLLEPA